MTTPARPYLPLTGKWWLRWFLLSAGLVAALPVASLAVFLAGVLVGVGCLLWFLIIYLALYGVASLPVLFALAIVIGILAGAKDNKQGGCGGAGCLTLIAIGVLPGFVGGLWTWAGTVAGPAGEATWKFCGGVWSALSPVGVGIFEFFLKFQLYAWPWLPFAAAVAVSLGFVAVLLVARSDAVLRRWTGRVKYQCPRCPGRLEELVCGGCGQATAGVWPTRRGIWYAACPACDDRLATTGWSGQRRLARRCTGCKQSAHHPDLGAVPEVHLAVVGASSAGKTNLLHAALHHLHATFGPTHRLSVRAGGTTDDRTLNYWYGRREAGTVEPPTPRCPRTPAVTVSLRPHSGGAGGCLIYLYDPSGEDIRAADDQDGGHDFHALLDGAIVVLDPFAEGVPGGAAAGVRPATAPLHEVFGRLLPVWQRERRVAASGRFALPVAVAVTKLDALPPDAADRLLSDLPAGRLSPAAAAAAAAARSAAVRDFLKDAGCDDALQLIDSHFTDVRFFGTTALGRPASAPNRGPFRERGAVSPLLWLLVRTGGLSGRPGPVRAAAETVGYWARSLRGLEGKSAGRRAWVGVVLLAAAAAGLGYWWLGPWAAGVTAVAVVAAAVVARARVRR